MKKIISILLCTIMLMATMASCDLKKDDENTRTAPKYDELDFSEVKDISKVSVSETETDYVIMEVYNYGTIVIRLFPEVAPETVANFKKLVAKNFYDGIIFHRVIEGFMIQCGDPKGDGTGGSDETIKGEFTSNGFENNLIHTRGVVSMARGDDVNSASSQFFIVQEDSEHLDEKYASFGYVVYGMDVVDDIASVSTDSSDMPYMPIRINTVRFATVSE